MRRDGVLLSGLNLRVRSRDEDNIYFCGYHMVVHVEYYKYLGVIYDSLSWD